MNGSGRSRGSIGRRGAGLWAVLVALAISLILVAVVLLVTRGSGGSPSGRDFNVEDVPEITGPAGPVRDLREEQPLGSTGRATVTLKDRNDPTRIAWELESAASEPVAGTDRYELTEPVARYFVDDATVILISADRASFVMPEVGGEPESGRFEGNVELIQTERGASESASAVRMTTTWIEFDTVAGEIATAAPVRVEGDRVTADCAGFRAVLNEVDEKLQLFEAPGGIVATVLPASAASDRRDDAVTQRAPSTAPAQANGGAASDSGGTPEPTAQADRDEPVVQYYAATFAGDVLVSQPSRRIRADRARVWVRLEDNSLAGGGLSSATPGPMLPLEAALLSLALAGQPEDGSAGGQDELGFDQPIEFRCTGSATVRPMDDRPAPLGSGDELALRFEVDEGRRVEFEDDALEATGDAETLEYGFTNRMLTLTGPAEAPARARVAGSGTLVAENVTLGLSTGIGQAKGPGRIEGDGEAGERFVSWQEQADVVFRVRGEWMTGSLEQAIASGDVELVDGVSRVTADDLNARFAEAGDRSLIEHVVVAGNVQASTAEGTLESDRVNVRFEVNDGDSRPVLAVATGGVRGEQDGQRIWGEKIEADLIRGEGGETEVGSARADGAVRYERDDGTYAVGETASIEAKARTAVIEGAPGVVASGGATIESERIELDDAASSVVTPGRGRLTVLSDDGSLTRVRATWTESMRYSDATGQLETSGDVEIVATPSPVVRDTFRGDSLLAIVEPADESAQGTDSADLGNDRRLVSAVATGTPDRRASAEFLRFAEPGDEDPVRVTAVVGATIEADNAAGVLRVPTAGRLVVSDTRASVDDGSPGRGSALFDWDGSMVLDRPAGAARMERRVRMVHRPMSNAGVIELECERLDASFEGSDGARLTDSTDESDLLAVDAVGAVWARSGDQQMLCDAMAYDPVSGVAVASAAGGGWVTLFGASRSTPITAAELEWNVESGRIDVVRPSPVSVPR